MKDSLITVFPFNASSVPAIKEHQFGKDWPVTYLLTDGRLAYVGQSVSFLSRMRQHFANDDRKPFKLAFVIADIDFNKSATLDLESWLIEYIAADGILKLQNGNGGEANHSYFDREKYRAKFEKIWGDLRQRELADKSYEDIRNSDIFKYSPFKALTEEQFDVREAIFDSLNPIKGGAQIISGEPGTGKTILAVSLIKKLVDDQRTRHLKIGFVVPMTPLRSTLKGVFSRVDGLKSSIVIGPSDVTKKHYDVLIVDEAHRLHRRAGITNYGAHDNINTSLGLDKNATELDWIRASSSAQILFYDPKQSVRPSDIRPEDFDALHADKQLLTNQLRVEGGDGYIEYVDELMSARLEKKTLFANYDFQYFDSFNDLRAAIFEKNAQHDLSRVVAGYAWDWKTKGDPTPTNYDFEIEGTPLKWNSVLKDWVNSPNAINEVGSIHTVQGYDLNYVGVIFGPEINFDETRNCFVVDKDGYRDSKGKVGIQDPEELNNYVRNIYKTLLTRGIKGTYVYAVNESMRAYLKKFVSPE